VSAYPRYPDEDARRGWQSVSTDKKFMGSIRVSRVLFGVPPNRGFRRDAGNCTRGRAAVSRVPACGHVAAAVSRVPRQRGHAMTYAAHVARQRGLAMRSPDSDSRTRDEDDDLCLRKFSRSQVSSILP